jgi:acyl dehydratase
MDLGRVLHGESSWEYLAPVTVGDQLRATRRLADITTRPGKRGGDMTLYTFETDYVNQHGTTVIRERVVVIQTGDAV